jgi:CBS domain-containing protein
MKVKEIMTKELVSIKPDDNAKDALDILFKMQISGLPVIDTQGRLVGMFTEKDILKQILPSYEVARLMLTQKIRRIPVLPLRILF